MENANKSTLKPSEINKFFLNRLLQAEVFYFKAQPTVHSISRVNRKENYKFSGDNKKENILK